MNLDAGGALALKRGVAICLEKSFSASRPSSVRHRGKSEKVAARMRDHDRHLTKEQLGTPPPEIAELYIERKLQKE